MAKLINYAETIFLKKKNAKSYESITKKDSNAINTRLSKAMVKAKRLAEQKQVSSRKASASITLNS